MEGGKQLLLLLLTGAVYILDGSSSSSSSQLHHPIPSSVNVQTDEYQLGTFSLPVCSYLVSDNNVVADNSIAATSFFTFYLCDRCEFH